MANGRWEMTERPVRDAGYKPAIQQIENLRYLRMADGGNETGVDYGDDI
jgi:hypothetical protein